MLNLGSFSHTSLSLGVEQGLQKLSKFDINGLRLLFHCNILILKKCPRKTLFKAQWVGGANYYAVSICKIKSKVNQSAKIWGGAPAPRVPTALNRQHDLAKLGLDAMT